MQFISIYKYQTETLYTIIASILNFLLLFTQVNEYELIIDP